jgi:CheY-like chemotaxis protein
MADDSITVLLVEDNPADSSIIRRMLRVQGGQFHIRLASKLWEGLERLQQGDIDVVLLDLGLPDSSGLDTLTRVRAQSPQVPIIVITGLVEKEIAVRALNHGAQDFIAKELVDMHLLSKAIQRATGRKSTQPKS